MSSRQAGRERREAERKARKAEIRRIKATCYTPAEPPEPSRDREGAVALPSEFSELNPLGFVSQTRREINRGNAQHSTGTRSLTGKLALLRNSLQHGLAPGILIIPGEDPAAFDRLTAALLDEHQPADDAEILLVHEMARSRWLIQRAIRLQNECFTDGGIGEKHFDRAFHKALNTLLKLKQTRNRTPTVREGIGFASQNHAGPAAEIGFAS